MKDFLIIDVSSNPTRRGLLQLNQEEEVHIIEECDTLRR